MSVERSDSARGAVLEVVSQMLWHDDEGAVRIADVCHATGLSSSVIYNYFRSRQGLIDAAYLEIYEEITHELGAVLKAALVGAETTEDIFGALRARLLDPLERADWERHHAVRLRVATAAVARRSLRGSFALAQDRYLHEVADYFADLQDRRLVTRRHSPYELASAFEGCLLSHAIADIAVERIDDERWLDVLRTLLTDAHPARTPADTH